MALPLFPIRKRYALIGFIGGTAGLAYSLTLSLIKPEKIDLRNVSPQDDPREEPAATVIPNRWNANPVKASDPKLRQNQPDTPNTSDSQADEEAKPTEQQVTLPPGCSIPPGGGPPINAAFEPC